MEPRKSMDPFLNRATTPETSDQERILYAEAPALVDDAIVAPNTERLPSLPGPPVDRNSHCLHAIPASCVAAPSLLQSYESPVVKDAHTYK